MQHCPGASACDQEIHVLRVNDYSKTVESDLESSVGYVGAIVSIKYIDLNVAVAFSSGRLFLCDKTTASPITELGNAAVIHCLSSRFVSEGVMELWAGERAGQMNVFTIKEGKVSSQENINHYERVIDAVEVLLIDTHVNNEMMFSYVYPGSVIYGWDCEKREMISRLDVGKLLPVKESIEEELNSKPLQVTVLRSTLTEVYVGTNRGFVFCTDVKHLRPITSFRPFTEDVRSFWVFREQATLTCSESTFSLSRNANCDTDSSDTTSPAALHSSTSSSSLSKEGGSVTGSEKAKDARRDENSSSPTPSHSSDNRHNYQVIVALGKGNSSLIEKNTGNLTDEKKQRRRAFAMLWFASEDWEG